MANLEAIAGLAALGVWVGARRACVWPIVNGARAIVLFGVLGAPATAQDLNSPPPLLHEVLVTPLGLPVSDQTVDGYTVGVNDIDATGQGAASSFNRILGQVPGVSQDSAGAAHFREEDPYYQYYINGILLPRGLNGFSQVVDTPFIDSVSFLVGALPAQFAWGNYGIISVHSKSGTALAGDQFSIYGGSHATYRFDASVGGTASKTEYFVSSSYLHNSLGIENPADTTSAIHDDTDQLKAFASITEKLTQTSSLQFMLSASHANFQIPDSPGKTSILEFDTDFPIADSAHLNETQTEQSYDGIIAYRKTAGDLYFQIAQVDSFGSVLFRPDEDGDLFFNGVASRVSRTITTEGLQADMSYQPGAGHTVSAGTRFYAEAARDKNTVAVFSAADLDPATGNLVVNSAPYLIEDDHAKKGVEGDLYLQDGWRVSDCLTVNYGGRFDVTDAYVRENQLSPRLGAVLQATKDTVFHVGFARFFNPPPLENVSPTSVSKFDGTTNAADVDTDDPVQAERSNYWDAGLSHRFSANFTAALNGFYKTATDQLDDGQFGTANVYSPYNYAKDRIFGGELLARYAFGSFSAYGNIALGQSWATKIVSSQFEFAPAELAYIDSHEIHLDQSQYGTGSAGASYIWQGFTLHADLIYGSGFRRGFANTSELPAHSPVDMGLEYTRQAFAGCTVTVRVDVINLFDQSYLLNDGSGVGVGASRYGERRGVYGGISFSF